MKIRVKPHRKPRLPLEGKLSRMRLMRCSHSHTVWREYALSVVGTFVRRHLSHGARHCTSVYTSVGECLGAPVVDYSRNVRREALEREQQATPLQ